MSLLNIMIELASRHSNLDHQPLFVFTGESNSGGKALNSDATAAELAPRSTVKILNNDTLLFEDLDVGTNNLIDHAGLTATSSTEHGWELQLANRVEDGSFHKAPLYLVKAGQGGTKIADWEVGATSYLNTPCWQLFKDRVDAAKAILEELTSKPVDVYIFYTQGINDANAGTNVNTWKAATIAHFEKIRIRYGRCPIVITKLMTGFEAYTTAIEELTVSVEDLTAVEVVDLPLRDAFHWNYSGMKDMCDRMIDKFKQIYGL